MARCEHVNQVRVVTPSSEGCEDCLRIGSRWVHLRLCLTCGHVGCCDSSPNKHARQHYQQTDHAIVKSFEPGEKWAFCFADNLMMMEGPPPPAE